jgi:hypothetical protein
VDVRDYDTAGTGLPMSDHLEEKSPSSPVPPTNVSSEPGPKQETSPLKTADRPHRITILLGLLSPALALVSLGVSFYVFHDSQRSMKVGQRAYLSFAIDEMSLDRTDCVDKKTSCAFHYRLKIENLGNTPAYIEKVAEQAVEYEEDHAVEEDLQRGRTLLNVNDIAPKEKTFVSRREFVSMANYQKSGEWSFHSAGTVKWRDAFNAEHTDQWCKYLFTDKDTWGINDCSHGD